MITVSRYRIGCGILAAAFVIGLVAPCGCTQRVIRSKIYSPSQLSKYNIAPTTTTVDRPRRENDPLRSLIKDIGTLFAPKTK